jgi:hypothetical protein
MAFPTLTLLDSFKRSENPLSNGGKWKTFFAVTNGPGFCNGTDWENINPASSPQGAYWSPIEFSNPGVALTRDQRIDDGGYWSLWACLTDPTTSKISGYRLKMIHIGSGGKFEVKLEKCVENSFSLFATSPEETFAAGDSIGLAVQAGKIEYWRKKGAGAWEERTNAADATYTSGFVGFASTGANGDTTNFEAGSATEGAPTIENPGKQRGLLFKNASLQIHALNVTKYFATNLPVGLSINEATGLITGEFESEESPVVKIKVENETAETAEASFEWVVTPGKTNALGMIVS